MKQLVLYGGKAQIKDVPIPVPHDEWVQVKVMTAPLCGGDRYAFMAPQFLPQDDAKSGHEGTGIVTAVDKSTRLKVGDRVILNPLSGCGKCYLCKSGNYINCENRPPFGTYFAQYTLVQDFVCTKLPDDIDFDIGALGCCTLGPASRAIKQMNVRSADTVLITGLGPVGLGAVAIAKLSGAYVIAVDNSPYRRKLASEMGADVVLNASESDIADQIQALKKNSVLSKAIECSGMVEAQRLCIDSLDCYGILSIIGGQDGKELYLRPSEDLVHKGLTIMGIWHYNLSNSDEMITYLRRIPNLEKLITHRFPMSEAQKAFNQHCQGDNCKILLKPWEGE